MSEKPKNPYANGSARMLYDEGFQAALAWLQGQMGEKSPCPCRLYDSQVCDQPKEMLAHACAPLAEYEGRQDGYAAGLKKRDELAWEFVDWLIANENPGFMTCRRMGEWLLSKGVQRP